MGSDMKWSGLAKFTLGFLLAIALLFFAGVTATRFFIARLTAPPPRPVFPNDNPTPVDTPPPAPSPEAATAPAPPPETTVESTSTPSANEYTARVSQPVGLILRSEPTQQSEQLGGVAFNQEVVVLETSPDGEWLRVRLDSGAEGWIKGGNIEPVN